MKSTFTPPDDYAEQTHREAMREEETRRFRVVGKTKTGMVVLFPGPLTHAEACQCKKALTPQAWRSDELEEI